MRTLLLAALIAVLSSPAFAQTPNLSTTSGHAFNVSFSGYKYTEPMETSISIHGFKFGGEYTGTFVLGKGGWFVQANARGITGSATYDGWCGPYMIVPNPSSPNGYAIDIGDPSPCSDSGNSDWYVETRGLAGKDFRGGSVVWAPYGGVGFRHLSNGTTGTPGYRKDNYLYLPLGLTARTAAGSHALDFNVEYDYFIRGWQTTYGTALGGGNVPPTATAPGFTIEGLSDIPFDQHSGWGFRTSATYHVTHRFSIEPYYVHWNVADSPVNTGTITFTVNGITAVQEYGAYEPHNLTHEFGVKVWFRF